MPRVKHDLLKHFPFRIVLEAASRLGWLSHERLDGNGWRDPRLSSSGVPFADALPCASPLEGWIPRERAHNLSENLQRTERELKQAKATIQELETKLIAVSSKIRSGHTTGALADLARDYEAAFNENVHLKQQIRQLQKDKADLSTRLEEEAAQLGPGRTDAGVDRWASHGGEKIKEEKLAEFLYAIFPSLDYVPGSIFFLVLTAHNKRQTLRKLSELHQNGRVEGAKRVQNSKNWLEVKFGTKGSSVDRMYYSHVDPAGRFLVVLSNKDMQENVLRRLKKL